MTNHVQTRPATQALLLFALLAFTHANPLAQFTKCLSPGVPFFQSDKPFYFELVNRSFRNDHVRPVGVIRALKESHVASAVKCAHSSNIRVCARSGGHSLVGKSLCKGILIDVRELRSVKFKSDKVATIGAGANLGEVLWNLWKPRKRWFAAGVCPGVGVGGYVFGGGHGPYEGRLGLACDALVSVRMVTRHGNVRVASRKKNKPLFWALCGAGGGQFGIITYFDVQTVSSDPFDNAVVFRFRWNQNRIGELMHKWMDYSEEGGDVWFRMEMGLANGETGMYGYGACYNIDSVDNCKLKLKRAEFFNTPSRTTVFMQKVSNALDTHAFFGPDGKWGRARAPNLKKAMLDKAYVDKGQANDRIYQSTFIKKSIGQQRLTPKFWQKYADFCANPGRSSIPWIVCELNLFNNAIDKKQKNAFAHRGADIITHYIVGGGKIEDRKFVYWWMRKHFKPFTIGVYVNYPELLLGDDYPKMYWGSSLKRLKKVKKRYDPKLFFMNPQPIPRS